VLDAELQLSADATQEGIRVDPSVELGRAAQGLAATLVGGTLSGVMYERDSGVKVTLEMAQIGEERSDFGGGVLVDAMQTHEGVEHQQFRSQVGDRGRQRLSVVVTIEPEDGHGDEVDVEVLEVNTGDGGDAFEAPSHDDGVILGGEQQHGTTLTGRKAAQAGGTGGNGDGNIESQEGLAAFWFPTDDSDRLGAPQTFDQPTRRGGWSGSELRGSQGRQRLHERTPARRGLRPSGANTSK
jgi:hypothetical protein